MTIFLIDLCMFNIYLLRINMNYKEIWGRNLLMKNRSNQSGNWFQEDLFMNFFWIFQSIWCFEDRIFFIWKFHMWCWNQVKYGHKSKFVKRNQERQLCPFHFLRTQLSRSRNISKTNLKMTTFSEVRNNTHRNQSQFNNTEESSKDGW